MRRAMVSTCGESRSCGRFPTRAASRLRRSGTQGRSQAFNLAPVAVEDSEGRSLLACARAASAGGQDTEGATGGVPF